MARRSKASTPKADAKPAANPPSEYGVFVSRSVLTPELCAAIIPRFKWTGSLGPAGPGNRCTQGHTWRAGEPRAAQGEHGWVFEELFAQLMAEGVLPLQLDQVESYRAWASATPAGVEIRRHAHDADVVVTCYLAAQVDPEPLVFANGESVYPEPGLVLQWPSSLEHWVPSGERRPGERTCAAWNITLRPVNAA